MLDVFIILILVMSSQERSMSNATKLIKVYVLNMHNLLYVSQISMKEGPVPLTSSHCLENVLCTLSAELGTPWPQLWDPLPSIFHLQALPSMIPDDGFSFGGLVQNPHFSKMI